MKNTMHRAQILLEQEQHRELMEIAAQEKRSISAVVRGILDDWLARRDREAQKQRATQALEALTEMRHMIQEQSGVYTGELLKEARDERDDEYKRLWRGEK